MPIPDVQFAIVGFALGAAEDFEGFELLPAWIQTEDFPTLAHTYVALSEVLICPGLVHLAPAIFEAFAEGFVVVTKNMSAERMNKVFDFTVLPMVH